MKIDVKKEIKNLYYLSIRYGGGRGWDSQKTFVRIGYRKKNNTLGSKMYCCSRYDSILFDNYEDCLKMKRNHNCCGEKIRILELDNSDNYYLEEKEIEGIKCYYLYLKDNSYRYNIGLFRQK